MAITTRHLCSRAGRSHPGKWHRWRLREAHPWGDHVPRSHSTSCHFFFVHFLNYFILLNSWHCWTKWKCPSQALDTHTALPLKLTLWLLLLSSSRWATKVPGRVVWPFKHRRSLEMQRCFRKCGWLSWPMAHKPSQKKFQRWHLWGVTLSLYYYDFW